MGPGLNMGLAEETSDFDAFSSEKRASISNTAATFTGWRNNQNECQIRKTYVGFW